jgi:hypothetical protein
MDMRHIHDFLADSSIRNDLVECGRSKVNAFEDFDLMARPTERASPETWFRMTEYTTRNGAL